VKTPRHAVIQFGASFLFSTSRYSFFQKVLIVDFPETPANSKELRQSARTFPPFRPPNPGRAESLLQSNR
jgi:hypothetical protein